MDKILKGRIIPLYICLTTFSHWSFYCTAILRLVMNILQKADCTPTRAVVIGATTTLDASQTFAINGLSGIVCPK